MTDFGPQGATYSNGLSTGSISNTAARNITVGYQAYRGFLPPQPYGRHKSIIHAPNYTQVVSGVKYGRPFSRETLMSGYQGPAPFDGFFLKEDLQKRAKFFANANYLQRLRDSDFNVGVTLIEAGKTTAHVTNTAKRLVQSYRLLRRGNIRGFLNVLNADLNGRSNRQLQRAARIRGPINREIASSLWLEYNYAWRPLLSDVHNAAHALANVLSRRTDDLRITGYNKQVETYRTSNFTEIRDGEGYTDSYHEDCEVAHNVIITARSISPELRVASAIGLDNPLLVAWEVVPFSFVADWFIPVGTWLSTMSAPTGFKLTSGMYGKRVKITRTSSKSGLTHYSRGSFTRLSNNKHQEYDTYNRYVTSSFPVNHGPPPFARIADAMGTRNMITSLALLQQVFKP